MMRKQLNKVMDKIINSDIIVDPVEPAIINEYKTLNDKCDDVITRIRSRKEKYSKNEVK